MGYRAKQNVFSWGTPNGREISEEVLDILSHQGNANQNNPEIPPHTSQIGQDPKIRWQQMLARLRRKRNTSPLLVGLQTNTTTLEISLAIPQKVGYSTKWKPSYSTSGHIPQRHLSTQQRYMHHNVHSSSIYNSQKLERTQMSFRRWMDIKIVVHLHNGVLLRHQKQWLNQILKKMVASREYHPEWDNPVTKEQT